MTAQATDASSAAGPLRAIGALQEQHWQEQHWTGPDARRRLQLALAGIWLLDAVLQFQSFMFSKGFAQMLSATAPGNPAAIADPIRWTARLIGQHGTASNAVFAVIQLLLALGIAWRPTVRPALAASVAWALGVWWFGEGLGGILNGTASPVDGAPGAVLVYALLAVLLWPSRRQRPAPFVAGWCTGAAVARAIWLVLWGSLAYLALQPATTAPKALSSMISGMAVGQPGWLAGLDTHLAGFLAHRGVTAAVVLAVILAVVSAGVFLPRPAVRAVIVLAIAAAGAIWVAEGLGGMMTGSGTDPNSAPLLALLALAYWPLTQSSPAAVPRPQPAEGA